jgi:hypothetical protein
MVDCNHIGDFDAENADCKKCKDVEECKVVRAAIRGVIIDKLESGTRNLLTGYGWTIGDNLASNPSDDEDRIIMLCEAFMNCFGVTELGRTGLMTSTIYERVKDLHIDLTEYQKVMKIYSKCEDPADFEVLVAPTLIKLEEKYSELTGQKIFGEPTKIVRAIKKIFYAKDMFPVIISQITTVESLNASQYGSNFNAQNIPRFKVHGAADEGVKR